MNEYEKKEFAKSLLKSPHSYNLINLTDSETKILNQSLLSSRSYFPSYFPQLTPLMSMPPMPSIASMFHSGITISTMDNNYLPEATTVVNNNSCITISTVKNNNARVTISTMDNGYFQQLLTEATHACVIFSSVTVIAITIAIVIGITTVEKV